MGRERREEKRVREREKRRREDEKKKREREVVSTCFDTQDNF